MFTDAFLDALGRWQRGWRQDPGLKAVIAAQLEAECAKLPERFRLPRPQPLYRKRHLYRKSNQTELVPLFIAGYLDEGCPTSWSLDEAVAEKFRGVFDEGDPNSAAGAIFRHVAEPGEVILDIPALWADPEFVEAAESYRRRDGAEAKAIQNFRGDRDQNEVILRAPLLVEEICRLSGHGSFDGVCAGMNAVSEDEQEAVAAKLKAARLEPQDPRFATEEGTKASIRAAVDQMRARWLALGLPPTWPETAP